MRWRRCGVVARIGRRRGLPVTEGVMSARVAMGNGRAHEVRRCATRRDAFGWTKSPHEDTRGEEDSQQVVTRTVFSALRSPAGTRLAPSVGAATVGLPPVGAVTCAWRDRHGIGQDAALDGPLQEQQHS